MVTCAASCAFYSFLSLFPLAALAASLVPCVGIDKRVLFPALPISLLVLLWSAAQAFSELLKGMAAMAAPCCQTGYLKRRLRAILMTAALLTTLLLSLAMLIFGARIALLLGIIYPGLAGLLRLVLWLRYLVMAALLWLLFVFLYRSIPGQRLSFQEVRGGAALAAAAWIVFSALFSLYADRLFDLTLYGSMAAMALTMLWLFYCQYILLVGAGLCAWKRTKKEAVPS